MSDFCKRGLHLRTKSQMSRNGCRDCHRARAAERYAKNRDAMRFEAKLKRCGVKVAELNSVRGEGERCGVSTQMSDR
jgi:uncharacterized protein YgiM (DUF1202 family)